LARRIKTNAIETNLKNISANTELVRELQGEVELLRNEDAREHRRYKAGEMTKNAFLRLRRENMRRIDLANKRIDNLIGRAETNLNKISRMVVTHRRGTARRTTRKRTVRRKTTRRGTARKRTVKRRTVRKTTTRKRTVRRKTTRRKRVVRKRTVKRVARRTTRRRRVVRRRRRK